MLQAVQTLVTVGLKSLPIGTGLLYGAAGASVAYTAYSMAYLGVVGLWPQRIKPRRTWKWMYQQKSPRLGPSMQRTLREWIVYDRIQSAERQRQSQNHSRVSRQSILWEQKIKRDAQRKATRDMLDKLRQEAIEAHRRNRPLWNIIYQTDGSRFSDLFFKYVYRGAKFDTHGPDNPTFNKNFVPPKQPYGTYNNSKDNELQRRNYDKKTGKPKDKPTPTRLQRLYNWAFPENDSKPIRPSIITPRSSSETGSYGTSSNRGIFGSSSPSHDIPSKPKRSLGSGFFGGSGSSSSSSSSSGRRSGGFFGGGSSSSSSSSGRRSGSSSSSKKH